MVNAAKDSEIPEISKIIHGRENNNGIKKMLPYLVLRICSTLLGFILVSFCQGSNFSLFLILRKDSRANAQTWELTLKYSLFACARTPLSSRSTLISEGKFSP